MTSRKNLMVIFSIILTLILVSNVLGADVETFKPKYAKTTENVNLRYQSSLNSNNILQSVKKRYRCKDYRWAKWFLYSSAKK